MFRILILFFVFVQPAVALSQGYLGSGDKSKLKYFEKEIKHFGPLPESFDWREQGGVSPVKSQGSCGSCWAFGITKAMESALMIHQNKSVNLSEQQMVSCNRGTSFGCSGGYMTAANYVVRVGLALESDFPYTGRNSWCHGVDIEEKALDYKLLGNRWRSPSNDEIKSALIKYGPLFVTVAAGNRGWGSSGTKVTACRKGATTTHIVTLIGYSPEGWIFRNSWGTGWKDGGDATIGYGCESFAEEAGAIIVDGQE